MKRAIVLSLSLILLSTCGSGSGDISDLQKANQDLTNRVKALENNLLETDKKLIQHQQALQQMHERLRDMEGIIDRVRNNPAR